MSFASVDYCLSIWDFWENDDDLRNGADWEVVIRVSTERQQTVGVEAGWRSSPGGKACGGRGGSIRVDTPRKLVIIPYRWQDWQFTGLCRSEQALSPRFTSPAPAGRSVQPGKAATLCHREVMRLTLEHTQAWMRACCRCAGRAALRMARACAFATVARQDKGVRS